MAGRVIQPTQQLHLTGRNPVPTGVAPAHFMPIRHLGLVRLPAEINPTAVQSGRKVDQPVLETADRKADAPLNKPLLDELFDGPAVLRERMTMLRVLLVIRVGTLGDKVAPKSVQHGQLVHLAARHVTKVLDLVEGDPDLWKHLVCLIDRKSTMTHGADSYRATFLYTTPPFITNMTCRTVVMSSSGLPATATRSAS